MKIEKGMVLCEALFTKEDGINYEDLGMKDELEPCPIRFRLSSVQTYNPGTDEWTTVRFINGDSFKINVPFEQFDKFIIENI